MTTKQHKTAQPVIEVRIRHVVVDGAETRLAQATDLLLRSAALSADTSQANRETEATELLHKSTYKSKQHNSDEYLQ